MTDAQVLRQRMVEGLTQRGELDERGRAAFTEVPRQVFVSELVWRQDRDAEGTVIWFRCAATKTRSAGWSWPTPTTPLSPRSMRVAPP